MVLTIEPHIQLTTIEIWEPFKVWYHNLMKKPRPLDIRGDIAIVFAYHRGELIESVIDAVDAPKVAPYLFCLDGGGYPHTSNRKAPSSYLHRIIMDADKDTQIDHIDGNRLNNCRDNLRVVTNQQNQMARHIVGAVSGYKGVHKHGSGYRAKIKFNGRTIRLGTYPTPERAAKAYNQAAKALFGKYAVLNKVGE